LEHCPVAYYRNDKFLKAFGMNIKRLRLSKNMSQEDLAFESDLELTQIGRIERGETNTSLSLITKIAKSLKIPVKDLFDF
jgi:transcriptional regulator with XRE-family HTH domain